MIKLSINHTEISTSCLETLVEGNVNSIFVEFSFSSEWEALGKTVFFSNGTVAVSVFLTDNVCAIPWEVLSCPGDLLVSLRGVGDGGSFVLCTENASLGKVEESLADDDADEPEEATADVIDTLVADVAELMAGGGSSAVVRGVDYWTDEDIAEIDSHIDLALSTHTGNSGIHVTSAEKQIWNGKQGKITASGLLKCNGNGGVTAAVEGTDYLTAATLPVYSGGVE